MRTVFVVTARQIDESGASETTSVEVLLAPGWAGVLVRNPGDPWPAVAFLEPAAARALASALTSAADSASFHAGRTLRCHRCSALVEQLHPHTNPTQTVVVLLCDACQKAEGGDHVE